MELRPEPELENQILFEGIEYFERNLDDELMSILHESRRTPEEADYVNLENETVTLYRGDSRSILEALECEDGSLERDFPIYFTESKKQAVERYAEGKIDNSARYLVEIEAPFEAVEYLDSETAKKARRRPEEDILETEKLYFMDHFQGDSEFAAARVPAEWIERIDVI